jgi:hypothetical protein
MTSFSFIKTSQADVVALDESPLMVVLKGWAEP